jgi:hypothetical protein
MEAIDLRRESAPGVPAAPSRAAPAGPSAVPARATPPGFAEVALVEGSIMHRRTRPAANAFTYQAFCLRLPLSALDTLEAHGIARNRAALVSFHDRDHGAGDGVPLERWIRDLLAAEGVAADGEIVLYAFPRMLGYVFNPVSFWVCHDRGGRVRALLAAVRNTFGERHNYLLAHDDGRPLSSGETLTARKVFHVSPFCEVKGRYAFRFHFAADRWLARIDYHDGDEATPLLETSISGRTTAVTRAAVRRLPLRYRWFTAGVVMRIHWQALQLWRKRVPFFAKPEPPTISTTR